MAKYWNALKKGDLVDIVAPGMKPLPGTMNHIESFLKSWGLRVRMDKKLIGKDLICSNTKEYRLKSLIDALKAKDSQMVWCMRGGYGSIHLLEGLAKVKAPPPKIFMGLSDITSLHGFLVQNWGWPTIHGSNIDRFALGKVSAIENKKFKNILFGQESSVRYSLKPLNLEALKEKKVQSSIRGGNLITVQSSFGTLFQIQGKGHILFFEDIGERAYRVDRVFEHMKQLGILKSVKAVLFGQFTGGKEPDGKNLVPKLLKQWASEQSFPVFSGIPSGHGSNQRPLPFGTDCTIYGGKKAFIDCQSGIQP